MVLSPHGHVLARLTSDIAAIENLVLSGVAAIFSYVRRIVFFLGALLYLWSRCRRRSNPSSCEVTPPPGSRHSFVLSDLTPDTLPDVLMRRFGPDVAERIARQLRAPVFVPLLNPYVLDRYLDQNVEALARGEHGSVLDIDALLDVRVDT
jgi:ABC-type multidrug transport system fused ATPase/permease subunit